MDSAIDEENFGRDEDDERLKEHEEDEQEVQAMVAWTVNAARYSLQIK